MLADTLSLFIILVGVKSDHVNDGDKLSHLLGGYNRLQTKAGVIIVLAILDENNGTILSLSLILYDDAAG